MKTILSLTLLALFAVAGCAHDPKPAPPSNSHPEREFNNESGNFERRPPFGPRSNKTLN
ncbi:MAG TPA: hypothetical protein VGO11_12235 [Chthoniobacteraceae bacterium]|nr:hypothetical protein [Chthoniobacteraceae bacterium]